MYREITMDNAMRTIAEHAAQLLLNQYRTTHPQWTGEKTPIDDLVQWVGLGIETFHPDDYERGVHGFVDPDEDENLIWLRRDLQEAFRRFTLAHELGHAILHCHSGNRLAQLAQQYPTAINISPSHQEIAELPEPSRTDPCADDDIQEDMTSILDEEQFQEALGIGQSYDPRSQREMAANIFAAEILLPRDRVLACYIEEQIDPRTLANRFGVSQAALLNRLAGMLKPAPPAPPIPAPSPSQDKPTAKKRYDEFQQAAIEAPTPALIVAGPGSGKTSTLIGRAEYLIAKLGVQPQHILALTFSRKAAGEMQERLQTILDAGSILPTVSTFHAFCAELLRTHGNLVGLRQDFTFVDDVEGYFLLRRLAAELPLHHYQNLATPTMYFPAILG